MDPNWRNRTLEELSQDSDGGASIHDRLPVRVVVNTGATEPLNYYINLYGMGRHPLGLTGIDEGFGISTFPDQRNPWKYRSFLTINAAIREIRSHEERLGYHVQVYIRRMPSQRTKSCEKRKKRERYDAAL